MIAFAVPHAKHTKVFCQNGGKELPNQILTKTWTKIDRWRGLLFCEYTSKQKICVHSFFEGEGATTFQYPLLSIFILRRGKIVRKGRIQFTTTTITAVIFIFHRREIAAVCAPPFLIFIFLTILAVNTARLISSIFFRE